MAPPSWPRTLPLRIKLFTFRFSATLGGFDESPLADFTRDKEVIAFREHFFVLNEVPHLACVVTYQEPVIDAKTLAAARDDAAAAAAGSHRSGGVRRRGEPPVGFGERDRALWVTLQEWRWQTSREEGVPPYVILTDRELTALVARKPDSPTALCQVPGIGPAKVRRYGSAILAILKGPAPDEATTGASPAASAPESAPAARGPWTA